MNKHHIVRAGSGRVMNDISKGLSGIIFSPRLGVAFELIHSVFATGATYPKSFMKQTVEAGYVISGDFILFLNNQIFDLSSGDSFRFSGDSINWMNNGKTDVVILRVIAPPVY